MFYLYDPRTNISTETSYDYLVGLTGKTKTSLAKYKSRKQKIKSINCYIIDDNTTVKERKEFYSKETYHDEIWKPVIGSDNRYLISNYGRIKRTLKRGKPKFILPVLKKSTGYLEVKVLYNGIYGRFKVSHLVARHFIGKPKTGEVLHHKNGIKWDSTLTNLEYQSKRKVSQKIGEFANSKPVVQLDKDTLEVIDEYRSAREASRMAYVSYRSVLDNCKGIRKVSGGYIFMFESDYEASLTNQETAPT